MAEFKNQNKHKRDFDVLDYGAIRKRTSSVIGRIYPDFVGESAHLEHPGDFNQAMEGKRAYG